MELSAADVTFFLVFIFIPFYFIFVCPRLLNLGVGHCQQRLTLAAHIFVEPKHQHDRSLHDHARAGRGARAIVSRFIQETPRTPLYCPQVVRAVMRGW